ncbi:MAG: hypothetical protein V8S72_07140 [Oscillospiraceae bacterium]
MSFYKKSLTTLELPAVLQMLSAEAVSDTAKELALELEPSDDVHEVRRRLEETTAAKTMMTVRGGPGFSGVKDVRASLARADSAAHSIHASLWILPACCNARALCAGTLRTIPWARPR